MVVGGQRLTNVGRGPSSPFSHGEPMQSETMAARSDFLFPWYIFKFELGRSLADITVCIWLFACNYKLNFAKFITSVRVSMFL